MEGTIKFDDDIEGGSNFFSDTEAGTIFFFNGPHLKTSHAKPSLDEAYEPG